MKKPKLFIGSSKESIDITRAIRQNLERYALVMPWYNVLTVPSSLIIQELIKTAKDIDFGVFVFSPDDFAKIRKEEYDAVRDNVIFELGLFVGSIGLERCYIIQPRGRNKLRIPSDLLGILLLEYDEDDFKISPNAALGVACDLIQDRIVKLGFNGNPDLLDQFADDKDLKNNFINTPPNK